MANIGCIASSQTANRRSNSARRRVGLISRESNLAAQIAARFISRKLWQNVAWNQRAYFHGFPANYDQRDLHLIARRVARRVIRRKNGS